jgi:hypothetical protein
MAAGGNQTAPDRPADARRGRRARFHAVYGAGPGHLLVALATLAVSGWAGYQVLVAQGQRINARGWARWFLEVLLLHDGLFLPAYVLAGVAVRAAALRLGAPRRAAAALQSVLVLDGLLYLVYFPVIGRRGDVPPQPYLQGYLWWAGAAALGGLAWALWPRLLVVLRARSRHRRVSLTGRGR